MADATVRTDDSAPKALDVPTTDVADLIGLNTDGYYEDENFRPDPLLQYGTVDTSDTGGGAHQDVAEVSPVFAHARAQNLATAARALDPEDPTPAELVTLPTGSVTVTGSVRTAEEAREEIAAKLRDQAENPVLLGGPTEQQRVAAEEREEKVADMGQTGSANPNATNRTDNPADSPAQSRSAAAGRTTANRKN
jgi:hypothetical protein